MNTLVEKGGGSRSVWTFSLTLVLLLLLTALGFRSFLTLEKTYLFKDNASDSLNQTYPMLVHISDYLRRDGWPRWSFNQGLGQNIIGRDLGDPFNYILFFMPRNWIAYGMAYMEALKVVLAGVLFYLYLRILGLSYYPRLIGSLCYAFCGYIILGGSFGVLGTETVYFAFLLFAVEMFIRRRRWTWLPPAMALLVALQPFNLYLFGIFIVFYAVARLVEEGWSFKPLCFFPLKLLGWSLLGVALGAVIIIGSLLQILQSPRITGESSYFHILLAQPMLQLDLPIYYLSALLRLFSNDLMGTGSYFRGWNNYFESPIFYCGLPILLLAPLVFLFLNRRQKILYACMAAICLLPVVFPYCRYILWAFTGDYVRTLSLFFVVILLYFGLRSLDGILRSAKLDALLIIVVLAALLFGLFLPYNAYCTHITDPALERQIISFPAQTFLMNQPLAQILARFLVLYAILIYGLSLPRYRILSQIVLLIVLCIELVYATSITLNNRPVVTGMELRQKVGYNDYTIEAVNDIRRHDPTFFRLTKNYSSSPAMHYGINDGMIQNYYGTSSYNSFNQRYYIEFLREMGIIDVTDERKTRWAAGLLETPLLQSLCSVKYLLSKVPPPGLDNEGYEALATFGNVHAYRSSLALPFGFTYSEYMPYRDFHNLDKARKTFVLYNAAVVDDADEKLVSGLTPFHPNSLAAPETLMELSPYIKALGKETLLVTEHRQNVIKGDINVSQKKLLFFSIPYDRGWKATVDGTRCEWLKVNVGFMGLVLDKGVHHVQLVYEPPLWLAGMGCSAAGLILYGWLIWKSRPHGNRKINVQ